MCICRGCPHYSWEIAVAYDSDGPIRFINTCAAGLSRAGYREACFAKPRRDTGERRRVTDGQSGMEPDHGVDRQTG